MTATQVFLIDRTAGRHRAFAELVPGGVYVPLGLRGADAPAINPWDVADSATVTAPKIDFLVRLNALLVGRRERSTWPLGLTPLERILLTIAIRDVYARAADGEGLPSQGFLREVLADLGRQERADPDGSQVSAATYDELSARLADVCAGGRFGHLLDRPTQMPAGTAPLVVLGAGAVDADVAAVVLLSIVELVGRLAELRGAGAVSLLTDAGDLPPMQAGEEPLPPAFARDSLLNDLHESYLRRRIRAGETRSVAYLHAISDVAHFLHPPIGPSTPSITTARSTS